MPEYPEIIVKAVRGGFTAKAEVLIGKAFWGRFPSVRYKYVIGVYPTAEDARNAAALMIAMNPASFGREGDSDRMCQPADIDRVRGQIAKMKS